MPCQNCTSNSLTSFSASYFYNGQQSCVSDTCGTPLNSKCVFYSGPNLSCSAVNTNDSIELALQKIDTQLCSTTGNYSTYNFGCLDDGAAITTEAQFVNTISATLCTQKTLLSTFTDTTFPAYQGAVNTRFQSLETPAIVCVAAGVVASDSLQTVLNKYCTKFTDLEAKLSIASVTWDNCFSVSTPPTTIAQGFTLLADQICQVKSNGGSAILPTFNNIGSCLASPGAADSLESTITKIKTKLCSLPAFNNTALSSICVSIPTTATDLQGLLQNVLSKLDALSQNAPAFNPSDFSVVLTDSGNPCSGKTVSLAGAQNMNRLVAVNATDTNPGTLIGKIAGVGITVDDTTTPGKLTLTASGTTDTKEVKASSTDDTPGFLDAKIEAGAPDAGFSLSMGYNSASKKLRITPDIEMGAFISVFLDYLENNATEKARFCALVATCPSPCEPPTNIQAIAVP